MTTVQDFRSRVPFQDIIPFLSVPISEIICKTKPEYLNDLEEIRLRRGQYLLLRIRDRDYSVDVKGHLHEKLEYGYIVNEEDIYRSIASISDNSLYAFEEEISRGFITIPGGHRVGLAGKAIMDGTSIRTLKDFTGLAFRIAREIKGTSLPLLRHICTPTGEINNTLIISAPRCGKTTVLRDIARNLSRGGPWGPALNVTIIDERSELGGSYQGRVQLDLGPRTDVLDACPKALGMTMAVRALSPHVVVVDEIGRPEDVEAIYECINAGVAVITSIHARDIAEAGRRFRLKELLAQEAFKTLIVLSRRCGPGTVEEVVRWDEI